MVAIDDEYISSMAMEGFKSYLNGVKDKTNTFFPILLFSFSHMV